MKTYFKSPGIDISDAEILARKCHHTHQTNILYKPPQFLFCQNGMYIVLVEYLGKIMAPHEKKTVAPPPKVTESP